MPSPLNPLLYGRLRTVFGYVNIAHAGIAASKKYGPDLLTNNTRMNLLSAGEYMRVACPYCNDTRGRLWINHLWGVADEVTGSKNLWAAICYNEGCLSVQGRPQELYDRVYGFKNANQRDAPIVVLQGEIEEQVLKQVDPPGLLIRMDNVPKFDPAYLFLKSKGFDPDELGRAFDVSLCIEASYDYPVAQSRIIIPVMMNDILVGWQARYPADIDWKLKAIPKYYNRPNMPRRLMLYNYDNAKKHPFVVISEGPSDVWNIGEYGVAGFGKHITYQQLQLLCNTWPQAIVIMLDGDAWTDTCELEKRIKDEYYRGAVIPISLPQDKDPGSLDPELIKDAIASAGMEHDIDLFQLKRVDNDGYNTDKRVLCYGYS